MLRWKVVGAGIAGYAQHVSWTLESVLNPGVEHLHVAARRYCADRFAYWADQYAVLVKSGANRRGSAYTSEAYHTFPRYLVLEAIRTDLERLTGDHLGELGDARELFALAGLTAGNEFTAPAAPEAQAAAQAEREAFARYVRELPASVLDDVEPLPYARVLPLEEAARVWNAVEAAWDLKPRAYWYPLVRNSRIDVEAFDASSFELSVPTGHLAALLARRDVDRIWELREYGPEYERHASAIEPAYTGAEGFWTSSALDWIIYASHESSITVGGWMLTELKEAWPAWQRHVWRAPSLG